MGIIFAKIEENQNLVKLSKSRGALYLDQCRPEYVDDVALLGLDEEDFAIPEAEKDSDDEDEDFDMPAPKPPPVVLSPRAMQEGEADRASDEGEGGNDRAAKLTQFQFQEDHTQLLASAQAGHKWKVTYLVRKPHVSVDYRDDQGRSALHFACEKGHVQVVKALIDVRAKLDIRTNKEWTPLHMATFHGQAVCIKELIRHKASTNQREAHGCSPLTFAVSSPKLFLVDLVSKADRRKRRAVKVDIPDGKRSTFSFSKGRGVGQDLGLRERAAARWKYYPNRIELIVMHYILTLPQEQNRGNRIEKAMVGTQVDMKDNLGRSALIYAARYGHIVALSRLLYAGADVNLPDGSGRAALFHAASNGQLEAAAMLLDSGASINACDRYFRTPLHGAMEVEDESIAMLLLQSSAEINDGDCEGRTPIMHAMNHGNRELFCALLKHHPDLDALDDRGWNLLVYAIETNMLADVLPLFNSMADETKACFRVRDPQGRTAMHHAVCLESLGAAGECARSLVAIDSLSTAIPDCNGDTAVHNAAELGRLDTLRTVIQALDGVDLRNNKGQTPLMVAAHCGHMACVIALLSDHPGHPPANAALVDVDGGTLLMHACASGHLDLVNLLLSNREEDHEELALLKLDISLADKSGVTAFMVAAREGHWQLLPSLVLASANIAAKDRDGFTALHWAATEDEGLATSVLLDLSADCDALDSRGWTPMMHAASRGCDDVVRLLIAARASLGIHNWDGDTALQLCARRDDRGSQAMKEILMDGAFGRGTHTTQQVEAKGHFNVSVLRAHELYLEGHAEALNSYCVLQFCPRHGMPPRTAMSSCRLEDKSPEWHETFRFDTEVLDTTAYLCAWLIAAPGDSLDEIMISTASGLDQFEVRNLLQEHHIRKAGFDPKGTSDVLDADFKALMAHATTSEQQKKGLLAEKDTLKNPARSVVPLLERRWRDVANLRKLFERIGHKVPQLQVPDSHLPIGCVVLSFRHLRAAVWATEPIFFDRTLRLSSRGRLQLEIDFRAKFFVPVDPYRMPGNEEEDKNMTFDTPRAPHDDELLSSQEAAASPAAAAGPTPYQLATFYSTLPPASEKDTPDVCNQLLQIAAWSREADRARRRLGIPSDAKSQAVSDKLKRAVDQVKDVQHWHPRRQNFLDTAIQPPSQEKERLAAPFNAPGAQHPHAAPAQAPPPPLPMATKGLKIQPWMQERLEGTRLF